MSEVRQVDVDVFRQGRFDGAGFHACRCACIAFLAAAALATAAVVHSAAARAATLAAAIAALAAVIAARAGTRFNN